MLRLRWSAAAAVLAGAVVLAGSAGATAAAPSAPGPDITVVGFGLATATATASPGWQLNMNFQVENPVLSRALEDMEAALRHAAVRLERAGVPAREITVQSININLNQNNPLQVDQSVMVDLQTSTQVQAVAKAISSPPTLVALNNYFLNMGGAPTVVSPTALAAAYAHAYRNARATAQAIAQAQGLRLGPAISESQGQTSTACGMGGGCPVVNYNGSVGPNQEVEAVTITFATVRPS